MNYQIEASIEFKESIEILNNRLKRWSENYKFKLIENTNNTWIYQRGNHFRASCSFDVRYVPSNVKIEYIEISNELKCLFHVKSFFYHAMPTDNSRVNEQLELLIAYLKGAFDEKLSYDIKM